MHRQLESTLSVSLGVEIPLCEHVADSGNHSGRVFGTYYQVTGERTRIIETELVARTYKSYGLSTIRYPVLQIEARVKPYETSAAFHCES